MERLGTRLSDYIVVFSICLYLCSSPVLHADDRLTIQQLNTPSVASLRGLVVAADGAVWACGSAGTILRSTDSGDNFQSVGPSQFEDIEFRSIYAWDGRTAVIASAGQPAVILRTTDGGQQWQEVFRHPSPTAFFDGLKFWDDQHGIAFSDPVDGHLLIVVTHDSGKRWQRVDPSAGKLPATLPGEAGFAASNSSLTVNASQAAWIGLGGGDGGTARVFRTSDRGQAWQVNEVSPIQSGPSSGIFSLAFRDAQFGIAVGGNYQQPELAKQHIAITEDGGETWRAPRGNPPHGFRSIILTIPAGGFLCAGPTGIEYSPTGEAWESVSAESFHTMALGPAGTIYAAGPAGKIAKLRWQDTKPTR